MSRKKLALDIDDVIANYVPSMMEEYRNRTGRYLTVEDLTWCNEDPEIRRILDTIVQEHTIQGKFGRLDSIPGAVDCVQRLLTEGHEVTYVTAREANCEYQTLQWLLDNCILAPLVITKQKGEYLKNQNVDMFVDDSTRNVIDVAENTGIEKVVLFDKVYNKGFSHPRVIRARGWDEVYDIVKG